MIIIFGTIFATSTVMRKHLYLSQEAIACIHAMIRILAEDHRVSQKLHQAIILLLEEMAEEKVWLFK